MADYAPFIGSAAYLQLGDVPEGPQCRADNRHWFVLGLKDESVLPSFGDTISLLNAKASHAKASKFGESKVSVCPTAARLCQIRDMIRLIMNDPNASFGDAALKHQCKPGSAHLKYILPDDAEGVVYELRGGKKAQIRPMIPRETAHLVLIWAHLSPVDGKHLGRDATYKRLSEHFSPSSISKDIVSEWIQKCSCHDHATHKMRTLHTPLGPYPGYTPAGFAPVSSPLQAVSPEAAACITPDTAPQPTQFHEGTAPIIAILAHQGTDIAGNTPSLSGSPGSLPSPPLPNPVVEDVVMGDFQPMDVNDFPLFDSQDGLDFLFDDGEMPLFDDSMDFKFEPSDWAQSFVMPGPQV